jgi:hypothetical protein
MMGPRANKRIALLLALIYLSLTGLMMVRIEKHALHHDHQTNHSAQHASFICNWMCASSTYTHTADQNQVEDFNPTPEGPAIRVEPFFPASPLFSFHIRPPPFSLS